MKKLIWLPLLVGLMACGAPVKMNVYNACDGSWAEIKDGDGRLLANHLAYGDNTTVSLAHYTQGAEVELLASLYSLADNHPLGYARTRVTVPASTSYGTGPDIPTWTIDQAHTTNYKDGGCKRY